ncbi:hypothetical protein EAI_05195 [Harpegnathos saltator]|uniref:Uncharacterized protein n=1 Tax=Harpegnathos saltator TaxID=610380 RepID=E2BGP8_HARSA|nr:hypothetical protein EAI_05195 [Harpegnathos saltator]
MGVREGMETRREEEKVMEKIMVRKVRMAEEWWRVIGLYVNGDMEGLWPPYGTPDVNQDDRSVVEFIRAIWTQADVALPSKITSQLFGAILCSVLFRTKS